MHTAKVVMEGSPAGIRKEHDTHVGCQQVDAAVLEGTEVLCVCHLRSAQVRSPCMFPSDPRGHTLGGGWCALRVGPLVQRYLRGAQLSYKPPEL